MNARNRALLWEELHVGGSIAGVSTAAGLLLLLSLRFSVFRGGGYWNSIGGFTLIVTVGIPLMTALLLVLNTANSGHLAGGFSSRILRLPVRTSSAVAIALLTRLALLLAVGCILAAVCWAIFHFDRGPGIRAVFIVGFMYLFVQVLDWGRKVVPLLLPAVALVIVALLLLDFFTFTDFFHAVSADTRIAAPLLAAFAASVAVAYVVSYFLVRQARVGEQILPLHMPTVAAATDTGRGRAKKPFSSPFAAQVWFELRRAGFFFPAMTAGLWLLLIPLHRLIPFVSDDVSREFRPFFFLFAVPLGALILASVAWSLKVGKIDRGDAPGNKFHLLLPLHKKQFAQARLVAAGVNLSACLVAITAVFIIYVVLTDYWLACSMLTRAYQGGCTNSREIAAVVSGIPFLVGLICWFIMGLQMRLRDLAAMAAAVFTLAVLLIVLGWLDMDMWVRRIFLLLVISVIASLITVTLAGSAILWRRGLIHLRALPAYFILWLFFAFLFFPFPDLELGYHLAVYAFSSLGFGALAVLPLISETLSASYRSPIEKPAIEKPPHWEMTLSPGNAVLVLVALAALCALAWMRWPSELTWKAAFRAKGLPGTLKELDNWYTYVPCEKNLANVYLKIAQEHEKRDEEFALAAYDMLAVVGGYEVYRGEPIPQDVWKGTSTYWDRVAQQTSRDLHAAAHLKMDGSRYPFALLDGTASKMSHVALVNAAAKILCLESLRASVARDESGVINAITDILPIAGSLEKEPLMISHLCRMHLYSLGTRSLEDAMNRMTFSDAALTRIQSLFLNALPPLKECRVSDRAITGELVALMNNCSIHGLRKDINRGDWLHDKPEENFLSTLTYCCFAPLLHASQYFTLNNQIAVSLLSKQLEISEIVAEEMTAPEQREHGESFILCWLLFMWDLDQYLSDWYYSEWRERTKFDLVRTSAGVERFRLAYGHLPQQLDQLVPAFLDKVPGDYYNEGKPISYKAKDNGEFVVYSYGPDFEDDGGDTWETKDIIFTVAPPELRNRPQVVPAAGS